MEKDRAQTVRRVIGYMQRSLDERLVVEDPFRWFVKASQFPGKICGCANGFAMAGRIGDPFKAYDLWEKGETRRTPEFYDKSLQNIASILGAPVDLVLEIETIHGMKCTVPETIERLKTLYSLH